jgi:hypothetical protein
MDEWDKLIDKVYVLRKLKIPMNQAIRDVAEANNVCVRALATEMSRRGNIAKAAKKAKKNWKATVPAWQKELNERD